MNNTCFPQSSGGDGMRELTPTGFYLYARAPTPEERPLVGLCRPLQDAKKLTPSLPVCLSLRLTVFTFPVLMLPGYCMQSSQLKPHALYPPSCFAVNAIQKKI